MTTDRAGPTRRAGPDRDPRRAPRLRHAVRGLRPAPRGPHKEASPRSHRSPLGDAATSPRGPERRIPWRGGAHRRRAPRLGPLDPDRLVLRGATRSSTPPCYQQGEPRCNSAGSWNDLLERCSPGPVGPPPSRAPRSPRAPHGWRWKTMNCARMRSSRSGIRRCLGGMPHAHRQGERRWTDHCRCGMIPAHSRDDRTSTGRVHHHAATRRCADRGSRPHRGGHTSPQELRGTSGNDRRRQPHAANNARRVHALVGLIRFLGYHEKHAISSEPELQSQSDRWSTRPCRE